MPTDEEFPFFFDCATSVTQRAKIELYAREGKDIPGGWVIGEDGETKTKSVEILKEIVEEKASLIPLGGIGEEHGGYKGYGFATVAELLSSALQSGSYLKMLTGFQDGKKVPYHIGHFFMAINVSAFTEPEDFKKTTGNILRELRASRKMPGYNRIFTAGEKEYLISQERKIKGIPLNKSIQDEIKQLIKELNLEDKDFHMRYEI